MSLKVIAADFETSAAEPVGWPEEGPDEIAFIGRSNVGKSSLLNALADRRGLARTSNAPGRTRLLNFFRIEVDSDGSRRAVRFVDLPGFGYAKVSKTEHATWLPTIEKYLSRRTPLRVAAVLIDARRVPAKVTPEAAEELRDERELGLWLAERKVTVIPVVTKTDKLAKHERPLLAARVRKLLPPEMPPPVLMSAHTGEGRDALWRRLLAAL